MILKDLFKKKCSIFDTQQQMQTCKKFYNSFMIWSNKRKLDTKILLAEYLILRDKKISDMKTI